LNEIFSGCFAANWSSKRWSDWRNRLLALFGLILWQAFRGQSIAQPDSLSLAGFTAWVVLTAVALVVIRGKKGVA
jgi:hypothetical protein